MNADSSESGTALIEFCWLAMILLLPLVYIMIAVFDVQRASYGVSSASQAAAESFVDAPDVRAAHTRARAAAMMALDDHSISDADIVIRCRPRPASCLESGSAVRVTVTVEQGLPMTPRILGDQLASVTVDSSHTEPYGTFREGRTAGSARTSSQVR